MTTTNKPCYLQNARLLNLILAVILSFVFFGREAAAATVTIEGTELPTLTKVSDQFSMTHGVVFSSNLPWVTFADDGGRIGIYGTDPNGNPGFSNLLFNAPIIVDFVNPTDGISPGVVNGMVSAVWGDGGGDTDFLRLRAFDGVGDILGTVLSSGSTWNNISFSGIGIHQLIFDQAPGAPFSSDTFLDSLTFDLPTAAPPSAVPVPAAAWLFGTALIGLVGFSKRRKAA